MTRSSSLGSMRTKDLLLRMYTLLHNIDEYNIKRGRKASHCWFSSEVILVLLVLYGELLLALVHMPVHANGGAIDPVQVDFLHGRRDRPIEPLGRVSRDEMNRVRRAEEGIRRCLDERDRMHRTATWNDLPARSKANLRRPSMRRDICHPVRILYR